MLISTIVPTIQRETLKRTVESVLSQTLEKSNHELIIVNDSGCALKEASWQHEPNVRIFNTKKRDRSVARNAGAAIARGKYLHFLDDDDWLMLNGLETLIKMSNQSEADILVGSAVFVNRNGEILRNFFPDFNADAFIHTMAGEWIPFGAALVKTSSFIEVGGFNPMLHASEDLDLIRQLTFKGKLYGIPEPVVYLSFGEEGSTTKWDQHSRERTMARECTLDKSGVWQKLHQSVVLTTSHRGYWYGKFARIYLTSTLWNLRQRRIFDSFSRFFHSIGGILSAGIHLISKDFWQGLTRPHVSFAYKDDLNKKMNTRTIVGNH